MKLSNQLATAFALLVALALAMGGLAIYQMAQINTKTVDIAESWLPSIKVVGELRAGYNQIRRAEGDHALSSTEQEWSAAEKTLASTFQYVAEKGKLYEPLISTPEEAKAYDEFKGLRDKYFATHERLLKLSRGGVQTEEDTKAYFRGESREAFNAMVKGLQRLVEINDQGADVAAHAAESTYNHARNWVLGLLVVMALVSATTVTFILRSVGQQLGGEPADAAAVAARVAQGDLSTPVPVKPGDATSLLASLARMQQSLQSVVAQVRQNAEGVATASAQIAQGNQDLSGRTEEQASALEQTAATMEQLGTTVRHNADNARQANELAQGASTIAGRGGEVVGQVVSTMQGITDSSRRIGDIIGVIDGIAFQTNILALNAAVEAARAGEQGRGFAVVAGEVRTLAQRSAEAAREIKQLIGRSVEQVEQGTVLVDQAGQTMGEIVGAIQRVSHIVAEITSASAEQSAGVHQVGEAVGQMDQATQQNAALVEQSAAAAESLKQQAQHMVQTVAVFKLA